MTLELLWSIGIYDLRLPEELFWRLTLREYGLLIDRHNASLERSDHRIASVIAAIYNTVRDPKKQKKPFSAEDFLGKPEQPKQQSPDQMLEMARTWTRALGGREKA